MRVFYKEIVADEYILLDAAIHGDSEQVVNLLCNGMVDVNCSNLSQTLFSPIPTPLNEASREGHINVVRILIDNGANPNEAKKGEHTPLVGASLHGHKDVVKLLLDRGADPNLASKSHLDAMHYTALHLASRGGNKGTVKVLLEGGAEPNVMTDSMHTPLHFAAANGYLDVVKVLLNVGTNEKSKNCDCDDKNLLQCAKRRWMYDDQFNIKCISWSAKRRRM